MDIHSRATYSVTSDKLSTNMSNYKTQSDKLILKQSGALTVIAQRVSEEKSEVVDIAFGDIAHIKRDLESKGFQVEVQ